MKTPHSISSQTKFIGLIGNPITHSLSPIMQNAALAAWEKNAIYGAFPVCKESLASAILGAKELGFLGLNITLPHKETALSLCIPDSTAQLVGAVNTLRFTHTGIHGTNTDLYGFIQLCKEEQLVLTKETRAVVLGAGGAARAIVAALKQAQATYHMFSRQTRSLQIQKDTISCLPLERHIVTPYLANCTVLIDCTPRGITTATDAEGTHHVFAKQYPELNLGRMDKNAAVIDITVRNATLLSQMATHAGLRCVLGHRMLVHQGAAALAYWFSESVPLPIVAAMHAAIGMSIPHGTT